MKKLKLIWIPGKDLREFKEKYDIKNDEDDMRPKAKLTAWPHSTNCKNVYGFYVEE